MKKRRKRIFIILFLLLLLSFLLLLSDTLWNEKDKEIYDVSIIAGGKNSESLMIMKQGVDQAASEMNANISFLTLSEENNVEEQKQLIEREIKNGTDAIIISPVDYEKMAEPIEIAMKKVPIILVESSIKSKYSIPSISCDNYKLGISLGEEVIKNNNKVSNIVIIKNNLEFSSLKERYDGFMSIMSNTNNHCTFWELSSEEQGTYYEQIRKLLESNDIDIVVTFDADILEIIAQAKKDLSNNNEKASIEIYGTGSTSRIISFLEDKIISATAMQNEFNLGYLGVKTAVYKINGKHIGSSNISSAVISEKNMYSEENQRLLFPFIR